MKRISLSFMFLAAQIIAPVLASATCGPSQVCSDVSTSFTGQISAEGITVTWSTSNENASLLSYKLRRYNCSTPDTCSVDVATISPAGSCGTNHNYSYTDNPPTPLGQWVYTLLVIKTDGLRACAVDTVPQ